LPDQRFEREFHFEALREKEKSPILSGRSEPKGRYNSLYAPLSIIQRDLSVTGGPSTGGVFVGQKTYGRSDLATWSAVIGSGAMVVTGLRENAVFWQVSALPQPTWNSETGMQPTTDPQFVGFQCSPKRLAAITLVSKQLLVQSPDLDEVLLFDLARQLGSLVDQIALLGQGAAQNQPTGIAATTGVHQIATSTFDDFMHADA
jgi:HK97 family phage major capsid protein